MPIRCGFEHILKSRSTALSGHKACQTQATKTITGPTRNDMPKFITQTLTAHCSEEFDGDDQPARD